MGAWAEIKDSVVTNIIVADYSFISTLANSKNYVEVTGNKDARIGATYIDGVFAPWRPEGNYVWNEENRMWVAADILP